MRRRNIANSHGQAIGSCVGNWSEQVVGSDVGEQIQITIYQNVRL